MTTTVERTKKEQRATPTRPPGWVPDRHTGPGEWLTVLIALSVIAIALITVGLWSMSGDEVVVDPNAVMAERWMAMGAAEWRAQVGETAYREAILEQAYVDRVTAQAIAAWHSQLADDLMAQRWIARATAAWLAEGGELDYRSALADYPYWDGPPPPVVPSQVPVESRADMLRRLGAPAYVVAEFDFAARWADYPYADGPPPPASAPETRADMLRRLGAPDYVIENDTGQPGSDG